MAKFYLYPFYIFKKFFISLGEYSLLMFSTLRTISSWNIYFEYTLEQMLRIGAQSIPIVILTTLFSGMVTAVQAAYQFESGLIPTWFVGSIVGESVLLELAPMMTALVMTGRIGATITAELGTMRVTEQIDALESLSFDPIAFLIFPRIFAATLVFPVLIIIGDFFGILGGMLAAVYTIEDVSIQEFIRGLQAWFRPWDAGFGLVKGVFFGFTITSIACYKGFYTKGGAQEVGKSTTSTVVVSCVALVFLDYLLAALLL